MIVEATRPIVTRRHAEGLTIRSRARAGYIVAFMSNNQAWVYLSVCCWLQPNMSMAFIAMVLWASLVINAMSFADRSQLAMLLRVGPVVVAVILTPLVAPQGHGAYQTLIVLGLIIFILYTLICAGRNIRAASQIAEVQAALGLEREGDVAPAMAA